MVCRGLDHFGAVDAADQEADAPVDLPKPLLAVQIVAVLGTVAVGGGPRNHLHHFRPLHIQQVAQLVAQRLIACTGDVVLAARDLQLFRLKVVVVIGVVVLAHESLVHGCYPATAISSISTEPQVLVPRVSSSLPTATMPRYMSARLPAMVISSTGYWISPFSTQKPLAPRE